MIKSCFVLPLLALGLMGCERLGFEDPAKVASMHEAEGKAAGAACRHAGRGLEDCFERYSQAQKAAVFAGWREMNDYMMQNKIEVVSPMTYASVDKPAQSAEPKAVDKAASEKHAADITADEKHRTERSDKSRKVGGA